MSNSSPPLACEIPSTDTPDPPPKHSPNNLPSSPKPVSTHSPNSSAEQLKTDNNKPDTTSPNQNPTESKSHPPTSNPEKSDNDNDDKQHSPSASSPVLSPPKPERKKRKRSDLEDSSPNRSSTPSRGPNERSTRRRTEWPNNPSKLQVTSASALDTDGLDPEAMEAAAVAAQAEKDEAFSRARRTTRLAAGKIKQVDYKAAENAQGLRTLSPGRDDDVQTRHRSSSPPEPSRTSKRRAAQNHATLSQRNTRRTARARYAREETDSNEDAENSSSGRDGSQGEHRGRSEAHDVDSMEVVRAHQTRSEGRDRKKSGRSDSRRGKQSQAEADNEGLAYYGTRSSKRSNSTGGDSVDTSDPENSGDNEMLGGLEKRTNAYGFSSQDLSRIRDAIFSAETVNEAKLREELRNGGKWKMDESYKVRLSRYLSSAKEFILEQHEEFGIGENEDASGSMVEQLGGFVKMDIARMKCSDRRLHFIWPPRRQRRSAERIEKEEKRKASSEKARRKANRDTEDIRGKLEAELDKRRKLELDSSYVEIQMYEIAHTLNRAELKRRQLEKVVDRYKLLDTRTTDVEERVQGTFNQLCGEGNDPNNPRREEKKGAQGKEGIKDNSPKLTAVGNGSLRKDVSEDGGSVSLEDKMEISGKEEASPSQRQVEMKRLRMLITDREAEAERYQRDCERERMKLMKILDAKSRLEHDIYVNKHSHLYNYGNGMMTSTGYAQYKSYKDSKKDGRNGSAGLARSSGNGKGKSNNGKHGGSGSQPHSKSRGVGSSHQKGHGGRTQDSKSKKKNGGNH